MLEDRVAKNRPEAGKDEIEETSGDLKRISKDQIGQVEEILKIYTNTVNTRIHTADTK